MGNFYEEIKSVGSLPYIIAEIGSNHNGDMSLAEKMISAAKECGCDAVKFQSWSPKSLICQEEFDLNQRYNDSPKKHFGSLREMCEKYYLRPEQHTRLKEYCDEQGITFVSTPFSFEEVDLLEGLDLPFFKVASMDINNLPLLKYIAEKNKPIAVSTGMATLAEIENALNAIESVGNSRIVLLHCISIYPPAYEDINLRNISMLYQTFGFPVGFSDHSIGVSIPLASVALGSRLIEKHFTLDKDLPGWDHEVSADPKQMRTIVEESRHITKALGTYRRIVGEAEKEKKNKFRRSMVAKASLRKGHVLAFDDLSFKRPGIGIPPDEVQYVVGRKLNRDISQDEIIHWGDIY